jgi:hypothetical protein
MEWLKSKTTMVVGGCLALLGLQGYGMMSMRGTMEERMSSVERELQAMHNQDSAKVSQLAADLEAVTKRIGNNSQELNDANSIAEQLKKENAATTQRLRRELAAKADAKSINQVREETQKGLTALQQDSTAKFDGVNGQVQGVRTDLDATRDDLAKSKTELGTLIAHNSTELEQLRRRGERDYTEFDISKSKKSEKVGDVLVQLKKTDVKRQKFDVVINADDRDIEKKDRTANEPVTFLVGRDRIRYEFVVNSVDKDRIRGYLSTPKDKVLAAEATGRKSQ